MIPACNMISCGECIYTVHSQPSYCMNIPSHLLCFGCLPACRMISCGECIHIVHCEPSFFFFLSSVAFIIEDSRTDRHTGVNLFSLPCIDSCYNNTWDLQLFVPSEERSSGSMSFLRTQVSRLPNPHSLGQVRA